MGYRMKQKPASMRVAKNEEIEKKENRTCGECKHGCWNEWNLNYKGNRFYGYCDHSTWAKTKDGRGVFLDNSKACAFFDEGEKQRGSAK